MWGLIIRAKLFKAGLRYTGLVQDLNSDLKDSKAFQFQFFLSTS